MRQAIYLSVLLAMIMCACNFHDPVDDGYFSSLERIKGKNKPSTPFAPEIKSCEQSISVTLIDSTDEDGDDLTYIIYASKENPDTFDIAGYYNQALIAGVVANITEPVKFNATGSGTIYFWYTAFDGGRESDHSVVVPVSVPGTTCP